MKLKFSSLSVFQPIKASSEYTDNVKDKALARTKKFKLVKSITLWLIPKLHINTLNSKG